VNSTGQLRRLPELNRGAMKLNLRGVTFPPGMPSEPAAPSLGAALYYIVSGIGANTVRRQDRGPRAGSLIYSPSVLCTSGATPASEPLTFLAFNINPEGVPAVVLETPTSTIASEWNCLVQTRLRPDLSSGGAPCAAAAKTGLRHRRSSAHAVLTA